MPIDPIQAITDAILAGPKGPNAPIVQKVDDILRVCHDHELSIRWTENECKVQLPGGGPEVTIDTTRAKRIFRPALACVATKLGGDPYGASGVAFDIEPASDRLLNIDFNNGHNPLGGEKYLSVVSASRTPGINADEPFVVIANQAERAR